jgi:hypothetical protein
MLPYLRILCSVAVSKRLQSTLTCINIKTQYIKQKQNAAQMPVFHAKVMYLKKEEISLSPK